VERWNLFGDVKVAANHILDDVKTIEQSMDDLASEHDFNDFFTPSPTPDRLV
jgi:hypothetical protein